MATDRDAVEAAVLAAPVPAEGQQRIVYVQNTLALGDLAVSEAVLPDLVPEAVRVGPAKPLVFTEDGVLASPIPAAHPASRTPHGNF